MENPHHWAHLVLHNIRGSNQKSEQGYDTETLATSFRIIPFS